MVKIHYGQHLKRRLKERKFPKEYPKRICQKAKIHYFDNQTKKNEIEIITIYPISEQEIKNRLDTGRWRKL